jgi:hypothetical protein
MCQCILAAGCHAAQQSTAAQPMSDFRGRYTPFGALSPRTLPAHVLRRSLIIYTTLTRRMLSNRDCTEQAITCARHVVL